MTRPAALKLLLAAILALAAFLRLYQLDRVPPGLYSDEAMDGNNAMEAIETHRFQVFYPEDNGREGLYVNVAAISIAMFGNRAWALRLPAAIFGVATVGGLYLLAAEWIGPTEAMLAAFFLATSFWHLVISRMAFRAIAAPMFLVWSVYLILIAMRRRSVWWLVLAGVVYGLGFYSYPAYRVTPVLIAALLLTGDPAGGVEEGSEESAVRSQNLEPHRRGRRFRLLTPDSWLPTSFFMTFAGAVLFVVAPLAVYFLQHSDMFWGRAAQVSVFDGPHPALEAILNFWRTARMLFTRGDHNWRHNVGWRAELFWPVAVCFAVGLWPALRRYWLVLLWLLLAMLPAVFATLAPHALRSILMLPAACLIAALGARQIYDWLAPRAPVRVLQIASAAAILALCYEPYHTYFDVWAPNPRAAAAFDAPSTSLALRIAATPSGRPKIVVDNSSGMRIGGLPVDLEPVMFLTGSYTERQREEQHIHYVTDTDCKSVAASHPEAVVFCAGS